MKVRAKADGFIRVPTSKGERSRLMEKGTVFELPNGTAIAPWMEEVKADAAPVKGKDSKPAKVEPEKSEPEKVKGTGDTEVI